MKHLSILSLCSLMLLVPACGARRNAPCCRPAYTCCAPTCPTPCPTPCPAACETSCEMPCEQVAACGANYGTCPAAQGGYYADEGCPTSGQGYMSPSGEEYAEDMGGYDMTEPEEMGHETKGMAKPSRSYDEELEDHMMESNEDLEDLEMDQLSEEQPAAKPAANNKGMSNIEREASKK